VNTGIGIDLEIPSIAYIAGALIFGVFGWAAFKRGRRSDLPELKWGGLVLMLYPCAISQTWMLWTIGVALTGWSACPARFFAGGR